jgi:phosphoribosylformylglycinamidine synthase subunit PurSL
MKVHRLEVRPKPGRLDPRAAALRRKAADLGLNLTDARSAKVYLIEASLTPAQLDLVASRLLADPVTEVSSVGATASAPAWSTLEVHPLPGVMDPIAQSVREAILALVGVTPSVVTGLRYDLQGLTPELTKVLGEKALANPVVHQLSTTPYFPAELPHGHSYTLKLRHVPIRALSDEQLIKLSREGHLFLSLEEMKQVQAEFKKARREPTDIELETIAQTWSEHCVHKTLKATVRYVEKRRSSGETKRRSGEETASLFSRPRPGHTVNADGSVSIKNLLKSTVAAATFELMADGVTWPLSVFKDNSGVIEFDEHWAVNIKVETHNRPSAIEPYGGAATGAGGCIRDVIATGLGARPIANTDVFCVADPTWVGSNDRPLPPGVLPPKRILSDIVMGVKDYGNRMGIPTVNGAVYFDDRYVGNPLVFCGCVGILPRHLIKGEAKPGDRIIALGGRTGRDGIHGATFSSAELESTASTEFAHAVQIGNAIEEKRLLDAILRARDHSPSQREGAGGWADGASAPPATPLFNGITDCGAGGFSSAIGEMGSAIGAFVTLDKAPLKYSGLSYTEIWISEAQERMILAVPAENVPALQQICDEEGVELADLGHFGTENAQLILNYQGTEVGRLPMHFLHEGIPMPTREAVWDEERDEDTDEETKRRRDEVKSAGADTGGSSVASSTSSLRLSGTSSLPSTSSLRLSVSASLLSLLGHPTIASKHWLIRMYDHEVQGNTILKPLVGPREVGPGDAAVLAPVHNSDKGLAIACGLAPGIGDVALGGDPYHMALAGIDEAVRNLVCVGADPSRIAILDNFCWPSCDKPENMAALVRACAGCYDGAKAYRTPFVSGKDSLNNQLRYTDPTTGEAKTIEIPFTLLITGLATLRDITRCVSMDAKKPGNILVLVGETQGRLGGSIFQRLHSPSQREEAGGWAAFSATAIPTVNLTTGPATAKAVASLIQSGMVQSAHDVSDGGLLVSIAEMLIATAARLGDVAQHIRPLGADILAVPGDAAMHSLDACTFAFCESPSRYILEVREQDLEAVISGIMKAPGLRHAVPIARLNDSGRLTWSAGQLDEKVDTLRDAWMKPLDW